MAAAGTVLEILLRAEGIGDVVGQIRSAAGEFEALGATVQGTTDDIGILRSQLTSGAGAGQFGALAAQFRAIGLEAQQISDVASNFRERLFHDPIAIGAFGRSVLPSRLGGPQDETRELREAMEIIRSATTAEGRLYEARRLGLEVMLPLADADERHYRAMEEEGERRGRMVDEELRQLRANSAASEQRLKDLQDERDLDMERSRLGLKNWWRDNVIIPLSELANRTNPNIERFRNGSATNGSPQERHTAAVEANTIALATLQNELANAGPRGRAAIPAGLKGITLEKALESGKLQTGAFIP